MTFHELDTKELYEAHKYYRFISWVIEEGWEPYWIGYEVYVNTSLPGNPIRNINKLWSEYLIAQPEQVNEFI